MIKKSVKGFQSSSQRRVSKKRWATGRQVAAPEKPPAWRAVNDDLLN